MLFRSQMSGNLSNVKRSIESFEPANRSVCKGAQQQGLILTLITKYGKCFDTILAGMMKIDTLASNASE